MGDSTDTSSETALNRESVPPVDSQSPSADTSTTPEQRVERDAESIDDGKPVDTGRQTSRGSTTHGNSSVNTLEGEPPPLPPRPIHLDVNEARPPTSLGSLSRPKKSSSPHLQSTPTTAVSLTDIHTQSFQDGSRETYASPSDRAQHRQLSGRQSSSGRLRSRNGSEGDESESLRSYAPNGEARGDVESLLGEVLGQGEESPVWKLLSSHVEGINPFDLLAQDDGEATADFNHEFDELDEINEDGENEGTLFSRTITTGLI